MKRAFFVLGAQGSGTRMLTAAFIAAGCRGSAEHRQPMDDLNFEGDGDLVFRRSLPHGGEWPSLDLISRRMEDAGYEVVPVFVTRKLDYLIAHHLRRDRTDDEGNIVDPYAIQESAAAEEVDEAFEIALAFAAGEGRPLITVPYEMFVNSAFTRREFFRVWGLPEPEMTFYNANEHPRYSEVKALPW